MNNYTSFQKRFRNIQKKKREVALTPVHFSFHDNFNDDRFISRKRKTDSQGRRFYNIEDFSTKRFYSVTTIIDKTKSHEKTKALENWQKRVGKEAEKIKNRAIQRGNSLHKACENFILYNKIPDIFDGRQNYELFKQIYPFFYRIDNIRGIERFLYCSKLQVAGTADCIADFDGILSIIDFKTARTEKPDRFFGDYYCQESAYSYLYGSMYGNVPEQIVTLFAYDDNYGKQGHLVIKKADNYIEEFLARLNKFYINIYAERDIQWVN